MPFVSLPRSAVHLWWRSNLPYDDITQLSRSSKPLVLLLNPMVLSTEFLDPQFHDLHLSETYNMIAFDAIGSGRTECPGYISDGLACKHDTWVDAALIAQFAEALKLPPFHLFAPQNNSINAALRFTILWPDTVLSLTLCGVARSQDLEWVTAAYTDMIQTWVTSQDLETFEDAIAALAHFCFNQNRTDECELDRIVAYWQVNYNPSRCTRIMPTGTVLMTRIPIRPDEFARISKPVLILHGDSCEVHGTDVGLALRNDLVNASGGDNERFRAGGARFEILTGGPDCLTFPARFARIVNKRLATFLYSLTASSSSPTTSTGPKRPFDLYPPKECIGATEMRRALALQAELSGDPQIAQRDPANAWSFSRTPLPVQQMIEHGVIPIWTAIERAGVTHLRADGKPIRKYSERHHDSYRASISRSNSVSSGVAVGQREIHRDELPVASFVGQVRVLISSVSEP